MKITAVVSIAIATLLVACVLIPIVDDYSEEVINPYVDNGWQYDDYKKINNVESVSGVLEYVTISGEGYVHATGVGQGSITYGDGSVEDVTVNKANLDVVVALGQSNNAYADYDPSEATPPPIGTAYYYGNSERPKTGFDYATVWNMYPMVTTPGVSIIGDKAPSFCKEYYDHSGHKVYYVIGSWYGTSITSWQPGEQSYEAAATTVKNALSVIDTDKFNVSTKCYTWIQGETDYNMSESTYYDYFLTMHNAIMAGGMNADLDHCFISKVRNNYPGPSEAQIKLAENVNSITMATKIVDTFTVSNGLMGDDDLHYSQEGDNIIGKALAKSAANFYYPLTVEKSMFANILFIIPALIIVAILVFAVKKTLGGRD